uniref:Ran-binding protein 10-like n=1 Tax=Phallusia mammillata TaxID=59560 RepID=A0A6F9DR96_9ASCI|nr:ran-binding protein 10-like [Phallusia mammillata]
MATFNEDEFTKRLKSFYPAVDENETPLPRKWSSQDKFTFIGLSQDNLKVHYKGQGKTHRDAASIRASASIPVACGIYYFEVTIVNKGRDGYMGIGLSAHGVNLNRLPGWDKLSYGYHGDDGHSFCSTGTGQPYGPTFTTGDVVGCCLNLIDSTCFYTKNGVDIGIAFTDLPSIPLFPTVGLQTPNEELSVNFGQHPFMFDFEDYLIHWKNTTKQSIERYVVSEKAGQFQSILHELVSSYLIHHGYVASTEAFNRSVCPGFNHFEDITSIKNRQKIQKLVLMGRIGEAIETTQHLFPGLLANNHNLLFLLKVRQFIEMVNGTDTEVKSLTRSSSISSNYNSPVMSPKHPNWGLSGSNSPASSHNGFSPPMQRVSNTQHFRSADQRHMSSEAAPMATDVTDNGNKSLAASTSGSDSEMDTDSDDAKPEGTNGVVANGVSSVDGYANGDSAMRDAPEPSHKQLCGGNPVAVERMMQFGQQLLKLAKEIKPEVAKNKTILKDAYSLLAYTDPWNSPVGYQLDPIQREPVCAALNSAILESQHLPKRPPLLTVIGQAKQCVKKMISAKIGTAAFISVSDYLR